MNAVVREFMRSIESTAFHFVNQKGKIMKKVISILGILMFSVGLTACNTMSGMGKDVERGGEKMQGAAERQQQK
jgi:entericidin B